MLNYPEDLLWVMVPKNLRKLVVAEQTCTTCSKWFRLPLDRLKALLSATSIDCYDCVCLHCGKWQAIYLPGKYDSLHAETCYNQRYGFSDE